MPSPLQDRVAAAAFLFILQDLEGLLLKASFCLSILVLTFLLCPAFYYFSDRNFLFLIPFLTVWRDARVQAHREPRLAPTLGII